MNVLVVHCVMMFLNVAEAIIPGEICLFSLVEMDTHHTHKQNHLQVTSFRRGCSVEKTRSGHENMRGSSCSLGLL